MGTAVALDSTGPGGAIDHGFGVWDQADTAQLESALRRSSGESAGDESRTRDLNVGNVALYQLSYSRTSSQL